jgi:hypothetical protein
MDTIKGWFSKSETKMLGQDVASNAAHASRGGGDVKAPINERIAEEEEEE